MNKIYCDRCHKEIKHRSFIMEKSLNGSYKWLRKYHNECFSKESEIPLSRFDKVFKNNSVGKAVRDLVAGTLFKSMEDKHGEK